MSFGFGFGFPKRLTSGGGLSPRLYLDFIGTGSLPSTVTFSRGTNATLTDSNGRIAWAPHNLLTNSEDFEAAAWSKFNTTVTANATTAPDGTLTADKLVETAVTDAHSTYYTLSPSGTTFTFSFYAKAAERTWAKTRGFAADCYFDLANGVLGSVASGVSASITAVGNGWYRCSVTASTGLSNVQIGVTTGNGVDSYLGVAGNGIFIWGAQLNVANAPVNLLTWSEQFDNAAWQRTNATVTSNAGVAPDGTTTADLLYPATTGVYRGMYQQPTLAAAIYVDSFYVKASGKSWVQVLGLNGAGGTGVWFNLSNGTVGTQKAGYTGTIQSVGSGWYRVAVTHPSQSNPYVTINVVDNDNVETVTANGTDGVYIWGAQLNTGSVALPYVATTSSIFLPPAYNSTTPKNLLGFTQEPENAAWTKSNSYVQQNLLTWSQDFDNAAWQPNTSTVTANTTVAPNGTTTADTLVPNSGVAINIAFAGIFTAGASSYLTRAAATALQNVPYTASFYVKAGNTLTHIQFRNGTNADLTGTSYNIIVRLADGFVVSADGTATSQGVGNGWYRITLTFTPVAGSYYSGFWFWNDTNIACNGSQNVLVWGAQLVQGATAGDYTQTTSAAAPTRYLNWDGTLTGRKLVEDTATNRHGVNNATGLNPIFGVPYTYSVYAKKAERSWLIIDAFTNANAYTWFNLDTGTVGTNTAGNTATITSVGGGWYRCSVTRTSTSSVATQLYLGAWVANADNVTSYTGDGTSGIYVSDFQLSNSASVDPYVYNPQAAAASAAFYGPRFDYNPTTLAANGLLIEEQRTNLLTYSEQFDNAVWTKTGVGAPTANSATAPDGNNTADTITATAGTSFHGLYASTATTGGATYALSMYVKKGTQRYVSLLLQGTSNHYVAAVFDLDGGGTTATQTSVGATSGTLVSTSQINVGSGWFRLILVGSQAQATTVSAFQMCGAATGNTFTVDGTVVTFNAAGTETNFLWGSQLELGAFSTSYIPTVASQVTRNADSALILGDNFYTWYNPNQGTFSTAYRPITTATTITQDIFMANAGAPFTDSIGNYVTSGVNIVAWDRVGGVTQVTFTRSVTADAAHKIAYAYAPNNFGMSADASAAGTSASGSLPPANRLTFGANSVSSASQAIWLRSFGYYNTRLPDSTLQALTT